MSNLVLMSRFGGGCHKSVTLLDVRWTWMSLTLPRFQYLEAYLISSPKNNEPGVEIIVTELMYRHAVRMMYYIKTFQVRFILMNEFWWCDWSTSYIRSLEFGAHPSHWSPIQHRLCPLPHSASFITARGHIDHRRKLCVDFRSALDSKLQTETRITMISIKACGEAHADSIDEC